VSIEIEKNNIKPASLHEAFVQEEIAGLSSLKYADVCTRGLIPPQGSTILKKLHSKELQRTTASDPS
jgi:hypothetical protein